MAWPRRSLALGVSAAIIGFLGSGGFQATAALFTDSEVVPGTFTTATCFPEAIAPTISRRVVSKTTPYLAGSVRQGGTYYVYAEATDAGCGVATVRADVSSVTTGQTSVALVAGTYSAGGVAYSYRSAALTANAVLSEGSKAYTVSATDNASNVASAPFSVTVDNTGPTATDVQAVNRSATVGKPEAGDSITLSFSEIIDPESVLVGWTGVSSDVVVRITHNLTGDVLTIRDSANTAQLPLGSVTLAGTEYVSTTRDFGASGTKSSMTATGTTLVLTLGTPSGTTGTQLVGGAMVWAPSASATDGAGNACQTTSATESGLLDVEF